MKNMQQLKDLIKNTAQEEDINAQVLLRIYMMERLLERITLSKYSKNFILKGGLLVANLIGINSRSTVDIDSTISGLLVTMDSLRSIFKDIININTGDEIEMEIKKIHEIRHDSNYIGIRISLDAKYDKARIPIKIDITTGDIITPEAIEYKYRLLLDDRKLKLLAYNIETILAEKFETIISRSVVNTRMRDFYDIHILLQLKSDQINYKLLKTAIYSTSEQRNSVNTLKDIDIIIKDIFDDDIMRKRWATYRMKFNYTSDISWYNVKKSITSMCEKVK